MGKGCSSKHKAEAFRPHGCYTIQCLFHAQDPESSLSLLLMGAAICVFLRFSGGGGVTGAARRACGGIYKERFQSNQRRLTIKIFSFTKAAFSHACVDLSLHLSCHLGQFSQEDRC